MYNPIDEVKHGFSRSFLSLDDACRLACVAQHMAPILAFLHGDFEQVPSSGEVDTCPTPLSAVPLSSLPDDGSWTPALKTQVFDFEENDPPTEDECYLVPKIKHNGLPTLPPFPHFGGDTPSESELKAQLIIEVKNIQRSKRSASKAWHSFVKMKGFTSLDPARLGSALLSEFIHAQNLAVGPASSPIRESIDSPSVGEAHPSTGTPKKLPRQQPLETHHPSTLSSFPSEAPLQPRGDGWTAGATFKMTEHAGNATTRDRRVKDPPVQDKWTVGASFRPNANGGYDMTIHDDDGKPIQRSDVRAHRSEVDTMKPINGARVSAANCLSATSSGSIDSHSEM